MLNRFPNNDRSQRQLTGTATLCNSRRDELDIRRAVRALAKLDDHTLRDMGIRDRSLIELTVRFCRQC
ncbi:DUF1127 domain-containing protein [Bradyrhizobium centrolobii]|uniref:DUF1127 domain-containing protein n=1 Tax=Bradyrhizobium centrolobii TaxID=1505087 RepID=UPI000AE86932|nr:DUF1127 domain-containing protein [Bradyrhizobium centrolobii]